MAPRVISLFSGIGGLDGGLRPILACESDPACHPVLRRRMGDVEIHADVRTLSPPAADVVAGGWPCRDLSRVGKKAGIDGEQSGLFWEMLRVARESGAHTVVGENVPHMLVIDGGEAFRRIVAALVDAGFRHVAWRHLEARAFGLPHARRRVIVVASRHREIAAALHRPLPDLPRGCVVDPCAAGFYWTDGQNSICYLRGCTPPIKVGSTLSIASPPAVHMVGIVRKLSARECLLLQGLNPADFEIEGLRDTDRYRMAGNAVAAPVGRFAADTLDGAGAGATRALRTTALDRLTGSDGIHEDGSWLGVEHGSPPLATNLHAYLDVKDPSRLSVRAASGLLRRLGKSGAPCPPDLRALLMDIASRPLTG